jgi:hypothetical protein
VIKKLFFCLLLAFSLFAADDANKTADIPEEEQVKVPELQTQGWNSYDFVELKKDELARYNLVIDNKNFVLDFRWTLFVNDGLVTLYKYNKFNKQTVLYNAYRQNGFRIYLKERAKDASEAPYIYIAFVGFDKKKKRALFHVYTKDDKRTILVERELPKSE